MSSLSDKLDNEDLPQPLQDSSSQNNESSLEPSPGVQKTPSNENDKFFMALAFLASTRSKDGMTQVGACIVKGDPPVLVGLGYNGMPDGPGFKDSEMKWIRSEKHKFVCHAEMNAIVSAFRRLSDMSECTLYVTYSPCSECCKLIIQCGIKEVVYARYYYEKTEGHPEDIIPQEIIERKREVQKFPAIEVYLKPPSFKGKTRMYREGRKYDIDLGPPPEDSSHEFPHCVTSNSNENEEPDYEGEDQGKRDIDLSKDDFFMAIAKLATIRGSTEPKVGSCLVTVDPHRAISVSWNSQSEHQQMCAESNAIVNAFRFHADLTSSVLYTTSPPCYLCAKMIVQSGVKTIIYTPSNSDEEEKKPEAVKETFYRARIPYLEYRRQTSKRYIRIDLSKKSQEILEEMPMERS